MKMRTDTEIWDLFDPLWLDLGGEKTYPNFTPQLAHYTSISTLESILRNDEIWFSNPLLMNDKEEMRVGMIEGQKLFKEHEDIIALSKSNEKWCKDFFEALDHQADYFSKERAFDTYVLCFIEHDDKDNDGLLSMWRGYGDNGSGVAIVFDTKIIASEAQEFEPIVLGQVNYESPEIRREMINVLISKLVKILKNEKIKDRRFAIYAVRAFLERLALFTISTKHKGFKEEKEWRAVYTKEHDTKKRMTEMLSYSINSKGIEPKFKLKLKSNSNSNEKQTSGFCLEKIISKIILGPAVSNDLAIESLKRMFHKLKKDELSNKLVRSETPFRVV